MDQKFDFVFEVVAFIGVVRVVIVETTQLRCIPFGDVLSDGRRFSIRGFVLCGLKHLYSRTHQSRVVGEFWLVLEVLWALIIIVRRFLGPFPFVVFAAPRPIFVRTIIILRTILLRVR